MRINYLTVAPDVQQAFGALQKSMAHSTIDARTRHLVELRVSQINGCAYCLGMHAKQLRQLGENQQRLDCLAAYEETSLFDEREKAILAWADAVTLLPTAHASDPAYDRLREHLNEKETVDLTYIIATMNFYNRFGVSFRAEPEA